jgi:RNA polymerase sigma factor FliA
MQKRPRTTAARLAARDRLVNENVSIVQPIARMIAARVPDTFELEDLIGVGLIALVEAADNYRPRQHGGAPFSAYARMRVRGAMLDSISGRHFTRAKRTRSIDAGELQIAFTPDYGSDFDRARVRAKILTAAAELPERQREVLALYYGDGLTLAEISARYGVHSATASGWHMDAIRALRTLLGVKKAGKPTISA